MNFNNYIRNDPRTKQILIAKGIEQAWRRRFSYNIHSGVRVKIQRKNSSLDQIIKRVWMQSETSALSQNGERPSENKSLNSYQMKPILNNTFLGKNMNSIGIQTIMITQIDRQTSCDIVRSRSMLKKKSQSSTSVSETSASEDSSTQANNTSTDISVVSSSTTTLGTSENDDYKKRYRRNKNRNNNAIDTGDERTNNLIKMEEAITQLSNNQQPLQDIKIKTQCYSQSTTLPVLPPGKKRFLGTFLNLFSLFRLPSFKRDQVGFSTTTNRISDATLNEANKNFRSPTSRCRRSIARNFNHNPSIEPEKHYFQTRPEENVSAKHKASIQSFSDTSISTRTSRRQTNNSILSNTNSHQKILSHRLKKKLNRRQHSKRKENNNNRHHKHKYIHRKKQKHIPTSKKSSQAETLSIQPLPSHNPQSKPFIDEKRNITSPTPTSSLKTISTEINPRPISRSHTLSLKDNQYLSPPTDSIRLRVKNKNLISTLSKSKLSLSSISPIQHHQMNTVNEFKSILQQIKNIHINNNALDDNPTVEIPPLKIDAKEILTSNNKLTFFPAKNQNQPTSTLSSDSQSTEDNAMYIHKILPGQNEIIRDGIQELIRYQKLAKSYKLKRNNTVKEFLLQSTALSPESLHKLSIINEPNPTNRDML